MRIVLWIALGFLIIALASWLAVGPAVSNRLLLILVIPVFVIPPFGAFWMMYSAARYEEHPLPMILMAFVPYAFLWYYFDRLRPEEKPWRTRKPTYR
jgi:hypothetical protein